MKEQFKAVAALIAEPQRAAILWTLLDGKAYTATELAIETDGSASNTSMHLAKLLKAGLLRVEAQGRHRYYAFAGENIAHAIEALSILIPYPGRKAAPAEEDLPAIRQLRTCYDHLAGKTGVAITDAMLKQKIIYQRDQAFELTGKGEKWFRALGIDLLLLQQQRRSFLRPCLDWSERRYHMAGSLAAALLDTMTAEDWLRKTRHSRAVIVTAKGEKKLYELLRVVV